jgi:hypothetical protein
MFFFSCFFVKRRSHHISDSFQSLFASCISTVPYLVVESHSGVDHAWMSHRVLPCLLGGAPAHAAHHRYGDVSFHQFFTYLDTLLGVAATAEQRSACVDVAGKRAQLQRVSASSATCTAAANKASVGVVGVDDNQRSGRAVAVATLVTFVTAFVSLRLTI